MAYQFQKFFCHIGYGQAFSKIRWTLSKYENKAVLHHKFVENAFVTCVHINFINLT